MVRITNVYLGSLAQDAGILENDILLSINGFEINDVLDYRFYLAEEVISLEIKVTGPGKVYLQTMTIPKLAGQMAPFIVQKK